MKRAEILLNLVLGICGSLIATAIWQVAGKLYSRLKSISFFQISERFLTVLSVQKFPTRILSTTLAFVIAFFILVNLSPQSVIAPSGNLKIYAITDRHKKGPTAILTNTPEPSVDKSMMVPCKDTPQEDTQEDSSYDVVPTAMAEAPEAECYCSTPVDNSPCKNL